MTEVTENTDLLWGAREIAKYIRREEGTVQDLLKRGDIPARKIGKLWCSTKKELADPTTWRGYAKRERTTP